MTETVTATGFTAEFIAQLNANFAAVSTDTTSFVRPETYGAVGDGVTDDTVAIQAAIAAATGSTEGALALGGQYVVTNLTVTSPLSIVGFNGAKLISKASSTGSTVRVTSDDFSVNGVAFEAMSSPDLTSHLWISGHRYKVTQCSFTGTTYNGRLPGSYGAPLYGLYVNGATPTIYEDGIINGVTVNGGGGSSGIYVVGGRRLNFSNITVRLVGGFGMIVGGGLTVQDFTLSQFTALSCGLYGFSNSAQNQASAVDPTPMRNWRITSAWAAWCGWRSALDGRYGAVTSGKMGFDITDGSLDGLYIQAAACDCANGGMESKAADFQSVSYTTSATTSGTVSSGSVITLTSIPSTIYVGSAVAGTNISSDTYIQSINTTTNQITLTKAVAGTVSSGATLTFNSGIQPTGHREVYIDFQYYSTFGSNYWAQNGVNLLLEDSISDQFYGEKQYAKVFAVTKQAVTWRPGQIKWPFEIVASNSCTWMCLGSTSDGSPAAAGSTVPPAGARVVGTTNSTTAAGATVLNFASTTGIAAGQAVFGINIPDGTTVVSTTGTTVTISQAVTGSGVSSSATILFCSLHNDGNLYWLCMGADYSGSTTNNNVALQINCVSNINADVSSIGNGYGVYINSTRGAANAVDNVTVTARVSKARYGIAVDGTGTVTNLKFVGCDVDGAVGLIVGGGGGTNTVTVLGGVITGTGNGTSIQLSTGTNTINLGGDVLLKTGGQAIYGAAGTSTINISTALIDAGAGGYRPVEFNTGTYTVNWGNAVMNNGNAASFGSWALSGGGTATVTSVGGVLRRDLTTDPTVTPKKGRPGERMYLAAPTSVALGYVCVADDTWEIMAAGTGSIGKPVTKTGDFTVGALENCIINNKSGSTCTATLPAASAYTGRELHFINNQAQTLVSASSNVVPAAGGAAGTAILAATAGVWAKLVSDGSNWIIMAKG